jgi:hypothetical protein
LFFISSKAICLAFSRSVPHTERNPTWLHRWIYYLAAGLLFSAAALRTYFIFKDTPYLGKALLLLAAWLSVLMAGASILIVLLLSQLSRELGGVNVTAAAPVNFLLLGFAFYLLGFSSNPLTLPWFAWPFLGCIT